MKRKALITSTAILLVAVMCLATASYAWFTAGTQATIETFQIDVQAADSALQLAPADMRDGAKGTYTSALSHDDWSDGWAVMSDAFKAVSTVDGSAFYTAPYNDATGTWKSDAAATDGYVYFQFYAKAPVAGTATLSITSSGNDTFNSAVKIGVDTGAGFKTYDITVDANDSYQPMNAVGAECEKNADGYFVPVDGATGFATARTQAAYAAETLTFTAGEEKLITVALWLEGMDKDCTGSWTLTDQEVDVQFTNWTAA